MTPLSLYCNKKKKRKEKKKAKRQLKILLVYKNANQECQRVIVPICETGTIFDYLKACHNIGSETQKM